MRVHLKTNYEQIKKYGRLEVIQAITTTARSIRLFQGEPPFDLEISVKPSQIVDTITQVYEGTSYTVFLIQKYGESNE